MKVEFRLSMPNIGSWNGRWSGKDNNYLKYKKLNKETMAFLGLDKGKTKSWRYSWSDGWGASVTGRIMEKGERNKKSDGFCDYDWMIDEIIRYNEIRG